MSSLYKRAYYMRLMLSLGITSLLLLISVKSYSQVTGPQCVIEGIAYQYNINIQQQNSVEVCVTGGVIQGFSSPCRAQAGVSDIHIIWDSTVNNGSISVKSGSTVLFNYNIDVTKKFHGGTIEQTSISQTIDTLTIPIKIKCDNAKYGNCSPHYTYQWERSQDNLNWTPVSLADKRDLSFSSPLSRTTYFRRSAIETGSGSKAYSDIAIVIVEYLP